MPNKQRHGSLVKVKAGVYWSMALPPLAMGGVEGLALTEHAISEDTHGLWLGKSTHDPNFHVVAVDDGVNQTVDIVVPPEAYTTVS